MSDSIKIAQPSDAALDALCAELADPSELEGAWPQAELAACGRHGVFEWFAPAPWGRGWSGADIVEGHLKMAAASLTTTFVLTQLSGALRRLADSHNEPLRERLLPELVRGDRLATLGISHLTTSRQHLGRPALTAAPTAGGYRLEGLSPWVTGAAHVNYVLTGAVLPDGDQAMFLVPTDHAGVTVPPPERLVALTGSCTGRVEFAAVNLDAQWVVAGPSPDIMQQAAGARTGGLQTSTLALGLSSAAIAFIRHQAEQRPDLIHPAEQLRTEWEALVAGLRAAAAGDEGGSSKNELRFRSNSIVLRATQAALSAAKGAGFVEGHPAGRWCREALFFLVWSCPQAVVDANLCEFAGIET